VLRSRNSNYLRKSRQIKDVGLDVEKLPNIVALSDFGDLLCISHGLRFSLQELAAQHAERKRVV
jgi:hypothetical protein